MAEMLNLQKYMPCCPESGQSSAIVPVNKSERAPHADAAVLAYWLMFLRAPAKPNPNPDGSYWLGEAGQDALPDQRLLRDTPYSVCRGIRGDQ